MHNRLLIFSIVILTALCGLTCLGYHAVTKWAQGLEGARLGEFVDVAEQIRQDVKRKLDEFIQAEEVRNYTDYMAYYVPEVANPAQQQLPVVRSPLAGQFGNDLAYGYFQIEPSGQVVSPWLVSEPTELAQAERDRNEVQFLNIKDNIVPLVTNGAGTVTIPQGDIARTPYGAETEDVQKVKAALEGSKDQLVAQARRGNRSRSYAIESLQNYDSRSKVIEQQRSIVAGNTAVLNEAQTQRGVQAFVQPSQKPTAVQADTIASDLPQRQSEFQAAQEQATGVGHDPQSAEVVLQMEEQVPEPDPGEIVKIRIDPFVPVLVPEPNEARSIFGAQVFLLRRVQIEDRHMVQGFQLNEAKLLEEIKVSAQTFMRDNMTFELCATEAENGNGMASGDVAYTAVLDFGFGDLLVYLKELDPLWIGKEIHTLRSWYFSTIVVVSIAVALALASFWHTTRAQVKLAQKKDDFISAVSHELRTPLTSIRMYAEMLENNWLKSKDKANEYYRNLRQESERLTRLVENVLDFSRLQRGQKRYDFRLGDINACIGKVVAMMQPYAAQHGFAIETDFSSLKESSFDKDAVAQIVVNLLDNAVKYAKSAEDKTITIRTRQADRSTIIEVEDHGPGIPHRHRKRVFEQFYRYDSPAAGQGSPTTGTGLGLALVKRFAEAHDGFVEILSATPCGSVFRVALGNPL